MSLDNTPQAFRPRHDELVPSRYALKVGDIDVLVISDGVLHLPTKVLVATADPAARQAVIDQLMIRMRDRLGDGRAVHDRLDRGDFLAAGRDRAGVDESGDPVNRAAAGVLDLLGRAVIGPEGVMTASADQRISG